MADLYHIQISVYVEADTLTGAKAAAQTLKGALEGYADTYMQRLDEVVIDSVGIEVSNIPADMRSKKVGEIINNWGPDSLP